MKRAKRLVSLLLVCVFCLQLLPAVTLAASSTDCDHAWRTVSVTEPTCTKAGQKTYRCSLCGATKTENYASALGHRWDEGTVTHYPKCTERGEKKYTCKRCGATNTKPYGEPLGHDWGEWSEWEAAEGAEGAILIRTRACKRCGVTETEEDPNGMGSGNDYGLRLYCATKSNGVMDIGGTKCVCFTFYVENQTDEYVTLNGFDQLWKESGDTSGGDALAEAHVVFYYLTHLPPHDTTHGCLYVPITEYDLAQNSIHRGGTVSGVTDSHVAVQSNPEQFDIGLDKYEKEEDTEDSLLLKITGTDPFYKTDVTPGARIKVHLSLTNTGTHVLSIGELDRSGFGYSSDLSLDSYSTGTSHIKLAPNETTTDATYTVCVNNEDFAHKRAVRVIKFNARVNSSKGIYSNIVIIDIDLSNPVEDAEESLTLDQPSVLAYTDEDFTEGGTIQLQLRVANTGTHEIKLSSGGAKKYDGDYHVASSDTEDYSGRKVLSPDGYYMSVPYTIGVTAKDCEDGKIIRHIHFEGVTTNTDPGKYVNSNTVTVVVYKGGPPEPKLEATITLTNTPAEGRPYYEAGEPITYMIRLYNAGNVTLTDLKVSDNMSGSFQPDTPPKQLLPGHGYVCEGIYVPKSEEIPAWPRSVWAHATAIDAAEGTAVSADSKPVQVYLGPSGEPEPEPEPEPRKARLSVTQTRVSDPADNRPFFIPGEPILFRTEITNSGNVPIKDITLDEYLAYENNPVGSIPLLQPGETYTYIFTYIGTAEDVHYEKRVNFATAKGKDAETDEAVEGRSHNIFSLFGEPIPTVAPRKDLCAVSLLVGEQGTLAYTVSHCTEHTTAAEKADALLAAAGDDPAAQAEAYAQAAVLWTDAVNALYDEICASVDSEEVKAVVNADREAFFAWADAYAGFLTELYPDQPERAVKEKAELIREKCAALCWSMHAKKGALPDSLLAQAVPQSEDGLCGMVLKSEKPGLLVYALSFCPEHAPAALELHGAMSGVLNGGTGTEALSRARADWEDLLAETEQAFTGPAAQAEQTAYAAYAQADAAFLCLFCYTEPEFDAALAKAALTRTLRLCPMVGLQAAGEAAEPEGGVAPTFVDLF